MSIIIIDFTIYVVAFVLICISTAKLLQVIFNKKKKQKRKEQVK